MKGPEKKQKRNLEAENDRIINWIQGIFAVILLGLFLMSEPWREGGCSFNERSIYPDEFKGRVIEKYIDSKDHNFEMLKFVNGDERHILSRRYYSKIEIGDSISKVPNSFILKIIKQDTVIIMNYKLECSTDKDLTE